MAATPETGFLVIADLTGYTACLSRERAGARPGHRRRPARDDRRPAGTAISPHEVRGRCRLPVRRGWARRRVAADGRDLRLLIDLRRLDVPLEDAARIAGWCHSGHCADATANLPRLIGERRAHIADRIARLQALDARLATLSGHLTRSRRSLAILDMAGSCCEASDAIVGLVEGDCGCCSSVALGVG